MSDVDRLREAADWLDKKPLLTWESVMQYDGYPSLVPRQYPEVADLLRAVADADRDLTDGVPSCITIPALALADAILGDSSHNPNATVCTHKWRGVVDGSEYCEECGKERWIPCCEHCGCSEGRRFGHDDTCRFGCNDDV